jgi:hypothetical protein
MHVAQLLDAFRFRPHVEIIVRGTESFLPDVLRTVVEKAALFRNAAGKAEFEGLQDRQRVLLLRFADKYLRLSLSGKLSRKAREVGHGPAT